MSIQTELTRITNAKAAIKAAVEGKGVTVPDGTLLDGMAALIESIEAGGWRVWHYLWDLYTVRYRYQSHNRTWAWCCPKIICNLRWRILMGFKR